MAAAKSKVNVKFVVLLSAVLGMVFVGVALAFVYIKLKSGDRYVRLADAALAAGDITKADMYYARAVGKDQSNVEWLVKWRDTRRKKVPETQTAFTEDYLMYVSILRTLANAKRTDVAAHREYLEELYTQAAALGLNREAWRHLESETEVAMRFFDPEKPGALRRYHGIAVISLSLTGDQVTDREMDGAREDLEAALKADPKDEVAANDLAVVHREAGRKALEGERKDEGTAELAKAGEVIDALVAAAPESGFAAAAKVSLEAADLDLLVDRRQSKAELIKARNDALSKLTPKITALGERLEQTEPSKLAIETVQRYAQLAMGLDSKTGAPSVMKVIDRALSASKDDFELMAMRSQMLATVGDLDGAIAQYQAIVDQPKRPVSWSGMRQFDARRSAMFMQTNSAMALALKATEPEARQKALAKAETYRKQLARNVAEHAPELKIIDGKFKYLEGDLRGSQRDLAEFINAPGVLGSQIPEARLLTADIASRLGQVGLAIDELEKVVQARPGQVDLLMNLAALYSQVQQSGRAASAYAEVLELDPTNEKAKQNLALMRALNEGEKLQDPVMQLLVDAEKLQRGTTQKLGDEQAAVEYLEKGAAEHNQDPRLVLPIARMRVGRNEIDAAKTALKAGLAKHPDDKDMKDMLGRLDSAKTVDGVMALIDAQPGEPAEKWWSKHTAYMAFGKRAEAKAALAEMAKLKPQDPRAIEAAFLLAIGDNDLTEAQRLTDLAVQTDADRAEGDTYKARLLLAKNQTREAAALLERAAQRGNATAQLLRLLGVVQLQMGRDQGLAAIKQALELNPTDLTTIKTYLSALVQTNRQTEALALARDSQLFAQRDPEFLTAWLALESMAGNRAFAVDRREQIYKRSPENLANGVALAALYCEAKQWDQARTLIDKLRVGNETDESVARVDAAWHADKGDLDGARQVFVNLIDEIGKKVPSGENMSPSAYLTFGEFMMARGRMDWGLAAMRQAERLQNPKTMDVSLVLGDALLSNGAFADAEPVFRKVLDAKVPDPRHEIVKRLIESLVQQRKLPEAEQEFVKLGANAEDDVELMAQRAAAARGMGELKRAREILDRAVVKYPGEALPYVRRARLLMLSPTTVKDAIADLDTAVKISPNMWQALRTRGNLLLEQGRDEDGLKDLTRAVEAAPALDSLRMEVIETLLKAGKESEAVDVADAALKSRPNDMRLIGSIGDRFAGSGRAARAQRYYKMLWQQLADEPSAILYVNALLSITPPSLTEAEATLATPSLNTDRSPSLLLCRSLLRKKQGKDDAARTDAIAGFNRSIGNPAMLAQWTTRLRKPFPEPRAALAVLKAVKAPAASADWLEFQRAAVMLEDAELRPEGTSILEGLLSNSPDRDVKLEACRALTAGYDKDKKWAEAAAAAKKGLDMKPDDVAFNNNEAFFLDLLNKPAEALPYAERASQLDPQNAPNLDTLGGGAGKPGQREKAMQIEAEAFRRARAEADKAKWALQLAHWKLETKDKAGATGLLDTLRETLSDAPGLVPEFKSQVDQLEKDIQGAP